MAESYLVGKKVKLKRQEGDTGSIVFSVDSEISLTGMVALFQVRDSADILIFSKTSTDSSITIISQTIIVHLTGTETVGYPGYYNWELQIVGGSQVITLGKGIFEIVPQIAR